MKRYLYIYEQITEITAEKINRQIQWAEEDGESELNIRLMTPGGFTASGIAMLNRITSFQGKINLFIDGDVSSFGAFMMLFSDYTEMSDMAESMFHKAAYPSWYEPTEEQIENLNRENKRFKSKMEKRLGEAGKELIEKVFNKEKREDVYLTANQLKKLGLVDKIVRIEPKQKVAFQENFYKQMLSENDNDRNNNTNENLETKKMEVKEKLEKAVKEAYAKGLESGKKAELDRISGWKAWEEIDKEAVKTGIESGLEISQKDISELSVKAAKQALLQNHTEDNVPELPSDSVTDKANEEKKRESEELAYKQAMGETDEMELKLKELIGIKQ